MTDELDFVVEQGERQPPDFKYLQQGCISDGVCWFGVYDLIYIYIEFADLNTLI